MNVIVGIMTENRCMIAFDYCFLSAKVIEKYQLYKYVLYFFVYFCYRTLFRCSETTNNEQVYSIFNLFSISVKSNEKAKDVTEKIIQNQLLFICMGTGWQPTTCQSKLYMYAYSKEAGLNIKKWNVRIYKVFFPI